MQTIATRSTQLSTRFSLGLQRRREIEDKNSGWIERRSVPCRCLFHRRHGERSATSSVYTIDNASPTNHVLQYQSGPNGVLSLAGTFSAQGAGTGSALASQGAVQLTHDGHWLLAVDAGSNQITVFQINGDGSLVVADVVSSQGTTPISLAVSDDLVYVLNSATPNIAGFTLSNNGQLTFIPGSIQPLSGIPSSSPEEIGFVNVSQGGQAAKEALAGASWRSLKRRLG